MTAGTYLINYSANNTGGTATTLSLYRNGAAVTGQSATGTGNLGGTSILTVSDGDTIALYNTGADTATLTNAGIAAVKLA